MKIFRLLALALLPFTALAQAPLPTSWDFSGTAPLGWSTNGTATYASSNLVVSAPSCKLDGTGDYVQIFLSDAPGNVTYYIGGTSTGAAWQGTFSVQESATGSNWTDLKVYTTAQPLANNSLVQETVTPNQNSRYIRFFFTNKVSGYNVALDNVAIAVAPAGPQQEINVKYSGNPVPSGSTIFIDAPVGTPTAFALTVENQGTTNALTLTLPSFSGANAGDFTVDNFPASVNGSSNSALNFTFNPGAAGTRLAQLSIPNNDANENPYIVNVYAVGGNLASEPVAQATNLTFPINKSYRVKGQFSAANPPVDGGYLVLRKLGSAITELPVDGQTYGRGDYIGQAQVVSVGQATSFVPRYTIASTDYYFAVFAYNGSGSYTNYATGSPLTGMVTTPNNAIGNYYSGINKNSPTFVTDLTALIFPHNQIFYGNYDETMVNNFMARDTVNGQNVITCAYTGDEYVYTQPFTWDVYSREHTYPHSWMPTFDASDPELKEYDDQHNLYPVIFAQANQPRLNYPLGEVDSVLQSYKDGKLGYDVTMNLVYEPRDTHKGRAARALMYMPTCYNGNGAVWNLPQQQSQELLKKWHFQHPPDNFDRARNDYLDSLQSNRNPFVDSLDFACYINFLDMTYVGNPTSPCYLVSVNENKAEEFQVSVFPVPTADHINVRVAADKNSTVDMSVVDMTGRVVYSRRVNIAKGYNLYDIDLGLFDSGMYNLTIRTDASLTSRRLVVVH